MPNDSVFNQSSQPLFTEQVNTYVAPGIDSAPEGERLKRGYCLESHLLLQ